ncbi:MAG: LTA synthase family protein, partial [Bacteroidaceae bacterium]|nr:LTA synthase family protein [Bacteroidaceae bacterium]
MKGLPIKRTAISSVLAFVLNIILVYVVYALCRVVYVCENWSTFSEGFSALSIPKLIHGSWIFDNAGIIYTNLLYAVLMLLPFHLKERDGWQTVAKWVFMVFNSLAVVVNLADAVYFKYTGRRTTTTVFQEFSHDDNLGGIFGAELLNHWYLVLIVIGIIVAMYYLYVKPTGQLRLTAIPQYVKYYLLHLVCFVAFIPLAVFGIRGGLTRAVRPITISNANQYVNRPTEAAIVLNTPFSMIRTIGKNVYKDPK